MLLPRDFPGAEYELTGGDWAGIGRTGLDPATVWM
jgi:hypothetical protein